MQPLPILAFGGISPSRYDPVGHPAAVFSLCECLDRGRRARDPEGPPFDRHVIRLGPVALAHPVRQLLPGNERGGLPELPSLLELLGDVRLVNPPGVLVQRPAENDVGAAAQLHEVVENHTRDRLAHGLGDEPIQRRAGPEPGDDGPCDATLLLHEIAGERERIHVLAAGREDEVKRPRRVNDRWQLHPQQLRQRHLRDMKIGHERQFRMVNGKPAGHRVLVRDEHVDAGDTGAGELALGHEHP